jgi:hypothetical protein
VDLTIIILYDDGLCEHYVGAWPGPIPSNVRKSLARQYRAVIDDEPGSHEENARTISFREVRAGTGDLVNIWNS